MTDDERIIATLTQLLPPDMAEMCSRRIRQGAKTYGPLDLATDSRDFAREAREELADAAYYLAAREGSITIALVVLLTKISDVWGRVR